MSAWQVAGIGVVGLIVVAAVCVIALTLTIRSILRMMAARAIDRVVQVGANHVRDGVVQVAKSVAEDVKKRDPKRIEAEVIRIAEQRNGKVTSADVIAALDVPQLTVQQCFSSMVSRKMCRPKAEGTTTYYIFENYLPTKELCLCPFCETEFPKGETGDCPNCGGKITSKVVKQD